MLPKKCIATKVCLLAMLLAGTSALADPIGTVTALTGTLRYSFDETQSQSNAAVLNLARGRVHIVTGLLGKRGGDVFTLTTPSASIDIRGSDMIAEYVAPVRNEVASIGYTAAAAYKHVRMRSFTSQAPLLLAANSSATLQLAQNTMPPSSAARAPGLYVQVLDGAIHLSNGGGTQNFAAGQFGYTASFVQPPVVLPQNPGIKFTPPPSFSTSTNPQSNAGGAKSGTVDCEVR
jgi:hypothetical protein